MYLNSFRWDDLTITVGLLGIVCFLCHLVAFIKKTRWTPVKAEVIDFHTVLTCPTSRVHLMPLLGQVYTITYHYLWKGEEWMESDRAMTFYYRLRHTKTCTIYVNPSDGQKFVSSFFLRMWRNLTVFIFLLLLLYALLSMR